MTNGQELLKELQNMVSEPGLISEETYRRLLLTAMVGVLTRLDTMADNPMIYFGEIVRKHPKVFWGLILIIILVFTFVDMRQVVYEFLGLPIPTIIP